jgi:hypothetical protein
MPTQDSEKWPLSASLIFSGWGPIPKSRAAYQDFLALWKDADADVPVLKDAQAEYAS